MNTLQIRRWTGSATDEVQFVGWKDRTRRAIWVRTATVARREITLQLPGAGTIQFSGEAFPDVPPVRITRTVLCLPACRGSKELATELRTKGSNENLCAKHFSAWELFTSHVLYPDPGDDSALCTALQEYKNRLRKARSAELRRIKKLPPKQASEEREALKARFSFCERRSRGKALIPVWKATLAHVIDGWGGILQHHLHAWWVKENGFNIEVIGEDARHYRRWLEAVAVNTRCNVRHFETRTTEIRHEFKLTEDEWRVHEARVRYQIDFADGTRAWLDGFVEADVSDVQSLRDFDEIVGSHKPLAPPPWHSDEFDVIWRHNRNRERVESLPLSNEFRALCQLLAARPDQTSQLNGIESQIGNRTRELDLQSGQTENASLPGKRRLRDMLRTKTGIKLLDWKVLAETTEGREKFIKLSQPTVAE